MNDKSGDGKIEDINPKLLRQFVFGARVVLNPMAAMLEGIVGQEVVKAHSGKFHPLFQVVIVSPSSWRKSPFILPQPSMAFKGFFFILLIKRT
ncbi:E1 ubiquitin-activating protein uba2 [Lathyrus oleraceus]|uniref:E1 ubiquitin-activating protein uba2 n=1 Tax=Pisum sativum TaxID=3888 RepID=A0A9D4Y457_PEA|nr:E1 ubiquitin-activating protein uba2 [Pisum sativum]